MTMRIRSADLIAGQPALRVREFARRLYPGDFVTVEHVQEFFRMGPRQAKRLIAALVADGYLKATGKRPDEWQEGPKGPSLASATAAPPLRRAKAERMLAEIIHRAGATWSAEYPLAFRVGQLLVFGSYLRDVPDLNDLDLAITWLPRLADEQAQRAFQSARIRISHRRFSNVVQEMYWPWTEARRFLLGGFRLVSLHDLADPAERTFVLSVPHRVAFSRDGDQVSGTP